MPGWQENQLTAYGAQYDANGNLTAYGTSASLAQAFQQVASGGTAGGFNRNDKNYGTNVANKISSTTIHVRACNRTAMFTRAAALSLFPLFVAAGQWSIVDSNEGIVLVDAKAKEEALTHTGRDFDGWIRCDQKTVLFVRAVPEDPFTTSVHEIEVPAKKERVLFDESIPYKGWETHYVTQPQLSSSGRILYILAQNGMSGGGVFAVDMSTKQATHITDGAAFTLIQSGKYAGDFLILRRMVSIVGGIYYVYRLYSADGKDLGLAGPKDMDLSPFGCNPPATQESRGNAAPTAPAQPQRKVIPVPAAAMAARLEKRVEPEYVVLVPAAISAVRKWKYKPYEIDGKPVPVVTTVDAQFKKAG